MPVNDEELVCLWLHTEGGCQGVKPEMFIFTD